MFSGIPDLFDKNFAIGYLIPSLALLLGIQALLSAFGIVSLPEPLTDTNPIVGTAVVVLLGWLVGIVLAATNRDIIRVLEGYGANNPLQVLLEREKQIFRKLDARIKALEGRYADLDEQEKDQLNELYQERVSSFPDQEKWLLPTSFGNAIRAFEVYPRLMYGVDSIALWPRLLAVIPPEYQEQLDDAKAHMDFWLNLGVITQLLLLASIGMRVYDFYKKIPVIEVLFWLLVGLEILLLVLFHYRAKRSAMGWGQTVKSAFDIYLPDLAAKLGLKVPGTRAGQKAMWENYGIAILYARDDYLPELAVKEAEQSTQGEGFLSRIRRFLGT